MNRSLVTLGLVTVALLAFSNCGQNQKTSSKAKGNLSSLVDGKKKTKSCLSFAEQKTLEFFADEQPTLSGTVINFDENEEEADSETGIYGIEVGVNEECLDAAFVKTKIIKGKDGKQKCVLTAPVEQYGERDCG